MKRLILLTFLLLTLCAGARATQITVSSFSPGAEWRYGGTTAKLRVYVSQGFLTSTGVWVPASTVGGPNFYQTINCTISSTTLTVPAFTLPSTTDASPNTARYTFVLYGPGTTNTRRETLFSNFQMPTILGTTITIAHLVTFNQTAPAPPRPGFPDVQQVQTLVNGSFSSHSVNTTSPITGGGALTSSLTLDCPTCLISGSSIGIIRSTISPTPVFDLASSALGVGEIIAFPSDVTVATGKVFDHLRLSKVNGNNNIFDIAGTGEVTGLNYNLEAKSSSGASSKMYGVIGNLTNNGAGATKGQYSRVTMGAGSTGVGMAGVFALTADLADVSSTTWVHQWTASDNVDVIAMIHADNGVSANVGNGILFHPNMRVSGAFFKASQTSGSNGNFATYDTQLGAVLFNVDKDGIVTTPSLVSTVATGTAPFAVTSTTPVANLTATPTTYVGLAGSSLQHVNSHIYIRRIALSAGTLVVTLFSSAVFTSSTSYLCTISSDTVNPMTFVRDSGSQITVTGTGTDSGSLVCIGN